jgi:hypothetical protein
MEHLFTKEQFITFRDAFKELARNKQITAAHIVAYNLVRGYPMDRGFTPITNQIKLANGLFDTSGFAKANGQAIYALSGWTRSINTWVKFFDETKDKEIQREDRKSLKTQSPAAELLYNALIYPFKP